MQINSLGCAGVATVGFVEVDTVVPVVVETVVVVTTEMKKNSLQLIVRVSLNNCPKY